MNPRYVVEPVDNHWEVWDTQGPETSAGPLRQLICVLHNEFGAREACRLLNEVGSRLEHEPVHDAFKAGRWDEPACKHDWRPVKSNGDLTLYRCRNCRLEALE